MRHGATDGKVVLVSCRALSVGLLGSQDLTFPLVVAARLDPWPWLGGRRWMLSAGSVAAVVGVVDVGEGLGAGGNRGRSDSTCVGARGERL